MTHGSHLSNQLHKFRSVFVIDQSILNVMLTSSRGTGCIGNAEALASVPRFFFVYLSEVVKCSCPPGRRAREVGRHGQEVEHQIHLQGQV